MDASVEEQDFVQITGDRLSQEEVTKFVTDPSAGAVSVFLGIYNIP